MTYRRTLINPDAIDTVDNQAQDLAGGFPSKLNFDKFQLHIFYNRLNQFGYFFDEPLSLINHATPHI
jgi:hypothetical protein